jgi:hypothetical protein
MSLNAPETPLITAGPKDEANGLGDLFIPDGRTNFADDKVAKAWVEENLTTLISEAESQGIAQRAEWSGIRDMVNLKHAEDRGYKGESDAFVPAYAKASATLTSHICRALFPTDQVVDCVREDSDEVMDPMMATAPGSGQDTEVVKAWMQYQLETQAQLRLNMKKFVRQLEDYGFSVGKVYWHKPPDPDKEVRLKKLMAVPGAYGDLSAANCEGLRFLTRDVFAFYCWPATVDNLDQASLVFEVAQVSKQDADLRFKSGLWKNQSEAGFPDVSDDYESDLSMNNESITGDATTAPNGSAKGELGTWGYVKECWFRMPVPKGLYGPGEVPGTPVPVKAVLVNDVPVEITRNPFWHQRHPYVSHSLNQRPGNAFGIGVGRTGLELQTLINDVANQTQDNVTYGLNPMMVLNPDSLVGNANVVIKPGGVVNTRDPQAVKWDRPPVEQVQYGTMQFNNLVAMLNDNAGAPGQLQGTSGKGAAKTATGSQILQGNVKTDIQDDVEDIELAVLIPTMQMAYMLGQQYEKNERWIAVAGAAPIRFTRESFIGQYKFRWLASSQSANKQVQAQQAMMFMQLLPGVLPLLQLQGKMVNPEPLMKLIYSTLIGGRDFDKVIVPMPMPPMGMPPGAPPGIPGGESIPGGDRARSATEQAPGGGGEPVPGEAEDFMSVRQGADDMAGMMGAMGGGFGDE